MKIPVGVSGRHAHVTKEHLEILFGKDYQLTPMKDLSQPNQYASEEKIDVISKEGKILSGVRILGPVRKESQVEISRSDAIRGKFDAPVRSSGDIKGSGACTLVGPKGKVELSEGVIIADRHIHLSLEDAKKAGVKDRDIVSVKVPGIKGGIMDNVLCRVSDAFALDFHIDTDDACAFLLSNNDEVEIVLEYKIVK
ncbi:phosphate propanoyltransferase [Acholeplasma sp. OttesenSCG-928-E16]|nr:phosphate propanoyltransferase [Acholeplasma sp. OttesenSCG-928-E16]